MKSRLHLWILIFSISLIIISCGHDLKTPPSFTLHPANVIVQQGREALFFVKVKGNPSPAITWERSADGTNWTAGEQSSGETFSLVTQPADNGIFFRARAVNSIGEAVSQTASLNTVSTGYVNQVTQYGISWRFDKEYQTGQFVTGDYWVVGPVKVVSVFPEPSVVDRIHHNGSMINPSNGTQSYDSGTEYYGHPYDPDKSVNYPVTLEVNSSLVSTKSVLSNADDPHPRPSIKGASVLTVLSEQPAEGSFRPGLIGTIKTLYNINIINWALLPGLIPTAHIPDAETIAEKYTRWFKRPWLLHGTSWLHRHIMPEDNSPSYHRNVAMILDEAAVLCITEWKDDVDDIKRKELVINYIQVAIDYYAMQQNGKTTGIEGAYNYRWPTIFAGIMFSDNEMRDMWINKAYSTESYHQRHLYYLERSLRTVKSDSLPAGDTWTLYHQRTGKKAVFWDDQKHQTPWAYHEELTPTEWQDGTKIPRDLFGGDIPGLKMEGYRQMHSASIPGFALAAYALNATDYFDFPEYFDYADRWMTETVSVIRESGCEPQYPYTVQTSYCDFVDEMWFKYRKNY